MIPLICRQRAGSYNRITWRVHQVVPLSGKPGLNPARTCWTWNQALDGRD